jgi:hypothetical protein
LQGKGIACDENKKKEEILLLLYSCKWSFGVFEIHLKKSEFAVDRIPRGGSNTQGGALSSREGF